MLNSPALVFLMLLAAAACEGTPRGGPDAGASACADQLQSEGETDVDCGGDTCPACANQQACGRDADCRSNHCAEGVCVGQVCEVGLGDCDVLVGCETTLDTIDDCGACGRTCADSDDGHAALCEAGECAVALCATDAFAGPELAPHWEVVAGAAPTYTLAGATMIIADAPFALTPSNPPTSWVYEPDSDLGNQLAWSQPFGAGDFAIDVDIGWTSSAAELTLGGLGLANAAHQLELMVGAYDGSSVDPARPHARLRRPGADNFVIGNVPVESASHHFAIRRVAGSLTVELDGEPFLADASVAEITSVVLFAVPHRNGDTTYGFGEVSIGGLSICP